MVDAIAVSNNDVVQVVWRYREKIAECLGFEVSRQENGAEPQGTRTPLPAWVGFKGEKNPEWQEKTTTVWPIQKFEWKDLTATRGKKYGYRIVPMVGKPGKLKPSSDQVLYAEPVFLTSKRGSFDVYFNRGILSTQFVAHQIKPGPSGAPNYRTLKNRIDQPGDPLREALAGQIIEGVESLLLRASQEGGACYAALYELDDTELVKQLTDLKKDELHLILSNTGADDATNKAARQTLHDSQLDITDRFLPSNHIGHNKFVAYVGPDEKPVAVLLGSTNWTDTGLCAQSNNALVANSPELAEAYVIYWKQLRSDENQAPKLRKFDGKPGIETKIDNADATVWFSPNTPKQRARPKKGSTRKEAAPPDLAKVFELMDAAKEAILFLVFQPGAPSIVQKAAEIGNAKPHLFIRGAATDPKAVGSWDTILQHRAGQAPDRVVAASAINDQFAFWQKELLKSGPKAHAIVHSKIVVIDPMSSDCVVITGSHNLGYQASYNNDENLLIVKGHEELARAYVVNVMDVYDHYRFRYIIQKNGKAAFSGLDPTDQWQKKYFDPKSNAIEDIDAWLGKP